jgi:hypothetical protein
MKQSPNEKEFFQSLYELCRKHKVNLTAESLIFKTGKGIKEWVTYDWVDVNGAWAISAVNDAVVANRVEKPAQSTEFTIKGKV